MQKVWTHHILIYFKEVAIMAKKKKKNKEKQSFVKMLKGNQKEISITVNGEEKTIPELTEASVTNTTCSTIDGLVPVTSEEALKKKASVQFTMDTRYSRAPFMLYENGVKMSSEPAQTLTIIMNTEQAEDWLEYGIDPILESINTKSNLSLILSELDKPRKKLEKWIAGKPEDDVNHESLVLNIPEVVLFTGDIKKGEPSSAFLFNLMVVIVRTTKSIEKITKKNKDLALEIETAVVEDVVNAAIKLGNSSLLVDIANPFNITAESYANKWFELICNTDNRSKLFDYVIFNADVLNQYVLFSRTLHDRLNA